MVNRANNMPARDNDTSSVSASTPSGTVGSSGGPWGGGKALIHPQRHNLKNRFELLKTLGEGTYGKVKLAYEKATGEQVAIKYVKKTKIRDEMDLNRIRREIRILSSLRHPHIVNIRQVFEKKDRIVLVMECALGGELYDHLNTHRHLPEPDTRRLFRQIVSAVHYMHQNSIVHRDIKLENIILDCEGNIKIADFGLANYFSYDHTLSTFCGSPLYASPEIVNGKPYHGPEVDVWSLGVVLYILSYGAMPFESSNLKLLRQQITDGQYAEPSQPGGAAGLIRHMLTVTPARRATVWDILNHWWVNLGHELTPDGRQFQAVPFPTSRTSHRTQGSFFSDREVGLAPGQQQRSCPADEEVDLRAQQPPAGLHRVPGARSSRKLPRTSLDEGQVSCKAQVVLPTSAGSDGEDPAPPSVTSWPGDSRTLVSAIPAADDNTNLQLQEMDNPPVVYGEIPAEVDNADHTLGAVDMCSRCAGPLRLDNAEPQRRNREQASSTRHHLETGSLDNEKTVSVFDSDRKPKRGILKRKGKFSGGDSGCCIMGEDVTYKLGESESGSNTSLPSLPSNPLPSLSSVIQPFSQPALAADLASKTDSAKTWSSATPGCHVATTAASSTSSPCPIHRGCVPITSSSTPTLIASGGGSAVCRNGGMQLSANLSTQHGSVDSSTPSLPNDQSPPSEGSCYVPCASTSNAQGVSVSDVPPPGALCTCPVDMDLTKVIPRRKGILKNSANRNSLLDDTRKRLSLSSLSSNSSLDFLDLSYDSGDGDAFVARCRSSSTGGQALSAEAGDRHSFCLDGEFTALSLEGVAAGFYPAPPCDQSIMDYSEAKQVVQQAFALINSNQN